VGIVGWIDGMFSMRNNDGIDAEFLMLVVLEESPKFFRGLVRSTVGSVPVVDHPPERVTQLKQETNLGKNRMNELWNLFFSVGRQPL